MLPLVVFSTYSSPSLAVTLFGRSPPLDSVSTRFRPLPVSLKEVTVSLPPLTTNTSLPTESTDPWLSRIGQPGPQPTSCVVPLPPLLTIWRCLSLPFESRSNTTTELPAVAFVCVYIAPAGLGG